MSMKLRCQCKGANCPPFKHNGVFYPDNETIKCLLPDLNRCADCMACVAPTLPYFRDDLLQIASLTLFEKGPAFDPGHESRASFGTFIRPRICVSLMNADEKNSSIMGVKDLNLSERLILTTQQISKPIPIWRSCQTSEIPQPNPLLTHLFGTSQSPTLNVPFPNS